MIKEALTVKEAAEYLGMTEASLRTNMMRRAIPYYKATRRRVYFKLEDLRNYVFATRVDTEKELAAKAELAALNK